MADVPFYWISVAILETGVKCNWKGSVKIGFQIGGKLGWLIEIPEIERAKTRSEQKVLHELHIIYNSVTKFDGYWIEWNS